MSRIRDTTRRYVHVCVRPCVRNRVHLTIKLEYSANFLYFCMCDAGAESFADAVKMATEMYRVLERKIVDAKQIRGPLPVSDDGAFAPDLENDEVALTFLDASIRDAGYEGRIKIALDMAASAFYKEGFTILEIFSFFHT